MQPYLTVPFKFTDDSFTWLKQFFEPITVDYQANAPRDSALINFNQNQLSELRSSSAWAEVLAFAEQHNLRNPFPQMFIYKSLAKPRPIILGNPHIDTSGAGGVETLVPIRFNILMTGLYTTEMVWWDITRHDDRIVNFQFQRPDMSYTGRLQARGNTLREQWAIVGEPMCRARQLAKIQEHASFVRTDILHALNWTGQDARLIFSVKFDNAWSDIESISSN